MPGRSARLILFNKPFNVLSQFTDDAGRATLREHLALRGVYPAGRLDYDSEGLLLLTDNGALQARISHPRFKWPKTYWVQVEGIPDPQQLQVLANGVVLKDGPTLPAQVRCLPAPDIWERNPGIRVRKAIPTSWLELIITEGRNRQVRRMTAAVGLPTLRLVRVAIGPYQVHGLVPGTWREIEVDIPNGSSGQRTDRREHADKRRPPSR